MKLHVETPLLESLSIWPNQDRRLWLKMEALQPCGSFKARGMGYACAKYVEDGATHLLASSGGNAGLAVAYSGRQLGVPVTVVVPKSTKQIAIDLLRQEGAEVIIHGEHWHEAHQHAMELLKDHVAYLHPFDDPNIWTGHASVVDEVAQAGVKPDAVVLSVGGGGLLCGVVEGLRRNQWEDVPIVAVETTGAASLNAASQAKEHIGIDQITSFATSLGATKVAKQAFDWLSEHPIFSHVVTDQDALRACTRFLDDHRILVEPACGASLAAAYDSCEFLEDKKNVLVIVCGGVGVTMQQMEMWHRELS